MKRNHTFTDNKGNQEKWTRVSIKINGMSINEIQTMDASDIYELKMELQKKDHRKMNKEELRSHFEGLAILDKMIDQKQVMQDQKLVDLFNKNRDHKNNIIKQKYQVSEWKYLASAVSQELHWIIKSKNLVRLKELIKAKGTWRRFWIDIIKDKYNPVRFLAYERDEESIHFLINQCKEQPQILDDPVLCEIIVGHAMAGREKEVKTLIDMVTDGIKMFIDNGVAIEATEEIKNLFTDNLYLIRSAVLGHVLMDHDEQVDALLLAYPDLINWAVLYYAMANKEKKVKDLIEKGANPNWALQGLAMGDHDRQIEEFINRGNCSSWAVRGLLEMGRYAKAEERSNTGPKVNLNYLITFYAKMAFHHHVERLLEAVKKKGNVHDYDKALASAIKGYGLAGDKNHVDIFIADEWDIKSDQSKKIKLALQSYAEGGHEQLAHQLRDQMMIHSLAELKKILNDREKTFRELSNVAYALAEEISSYDTPEETYEEKRPDIQKLWKELEESTAKVRACLKEINNLKDKINVKRLEILSLWHDTVAHGYTAGGHYQQAINLLGPGLFLMSIEDDGLDSLLEKDEARMNKTPVLIKMNEWGKVRLQMMATVNELDHADKNPWNKIPLLVRTMDQGRFFIYGPSTNGEWTYHEVETKMDLNQLPFAGGEEINIDSSPNKIELIEIVKQGGHTPTIKYTIYGDPAAGDPEEIKVWKFTQIESKTGRLNEALSKLPFDNSKIEEKRTMKKIKCNHPLLTTDLLNTLAKGHSLIKGASLKAIITGAIEGNYLGLTQYLTSGLSKYLDKHPLFHAATEGHNKMAERLREGESKKALFCYALGGHISEVNKLIEQQFQLLNDHKISTNAFNSMCENVVKGYKDLGYLEQNNIVYLLTFTNNLELRKILAKKSAIKFCHADDMLKKARINSKNLLEKAKIDSKNLLEKAEIESRNLLETMERDIRNLRRELHMKVNRLRVQANEPGKEYLMDEANNLIQMVNNKEKTIRDQINKESEFLIEKAKELSAELLEKAKRESQALRKKAEIESQDLFEEAEVKSKILLEKANKINHFMEQMGLNFRQAEALTKKGVIEWLLQGFKMCINPDSPEEMSIQYLPLIHYTITSHLTGLDDEDVKKISIALYNDLYKDTKDENNYKMRMNFISNNFFLHKAEENFPMEKTDKRFEI